MLRLLTVLTLFVPSFAFAEGDSHSGSGSEYFFQSSAGAMELTPSFEYVVGSSELESFSGTSSDQSGFLVGADFEYGMSELLAVGAFISYQSIETEFGANTTESTGLNNLEFFLKGTHAMGPGALKFGAQLSLSPGDAETKSNGDSNAYTGGHEITPLIGYEMASGSMHFGGKLSQDIELSKRTNDNNGTDEEYSGGEETTLSVFFENKCAADMTFGTSLDWTTTADDTNEDTNTDTESASPTQLLSVYGAIPVGTGVVLPTLGYSFTTDDEVDNEDIEEYTAWVVKVGYRIAL